MVCSEDHNHWFGLKEPYNAVKATNELILSSLVKEVFYGTSANDLTFILNNGVIIEIIATSKGYEAWEYSSEGGMLYIATGSGGVSEFNL